MPNKRNCRDCDTSLALYNGNCVRCYSCRAIHRREVWNRADKKRRRAAAKAKALAQAAKLANPAAPIVIEKVVVPRVTAKQIAAYMQAYTPRSYNRIVEEVRRLHMTMGAVDGKRLDA